MDFAVAVAICVLVGLAAGALVRIRGKHSSFGLIYLHVALLIAILLFAFYLFARLGLNPWSLAVIPLVSLILIYLIVRKAVAKVLQVR
ncbi:MAG TPA: hypothetical protein VMX35_11010 [Acidobacteriota bacterium]|nr:hypothetical protein [Acidobacteriota bacterium]